MASSDLIPSTKNIEHSDRQIPLCSYASSRVIPQLLLRSPLIIIPAPLFEVNQIGNDASL